MNITMGNMSRCLINFIGSLLLALIISACADNVEKASRLPPKEPVLSVVTILPESDQLDAEPDGVFIAVNKSIDIESLVNAIAVTDANGNSVEGSTDFDPKTNTITFIPNLGRFNLRSSYTVNVADGIRNTAGELLPVIEPWSFTVRDGVWGEFTPVEEITGAGSILQFFLNKSGKITLLWTEGILEAGQPTAYFSVTDYDPVTRSWESYAQKINIDLVDMRFGSKNTGSNMNNTALPIVVNDSENITLVGLGKNDLEIRAIRYIGKDQKWENTSVNLGSFSIDTYNSGLPNYFESLRVDNVGLGFIHVNWTEIATYGAVSIKSQYFNRISWWSDAKPLLDGGLDVGYGKSAMSPLGDFVAVWTQPNDNTGDPIIAARSYSSYSGTIYPKLVDSPYAVATTPIYGRIQDIHYVLNQTTGLEDTVYVRPRLDLIVRCIKHYEKQICGSSAKKETIAARNYVSKRVKVLYLYAWNLQVTTADTLVIQVLQNPKSALQTVDSGIFNNMLARLEGIISPSVEQMAWNQTLRAMG